MLSALISKLDYAGAVKLLRSKNYENLLAAEIKQQYLTKKDRNQVEASLKDFFENDLYNMPLIEETIKQCESTIEMTLVIADLLKFTATTSCNEVQELAEALQIIDAWTRRFQASKA